MTPALLARHRAATLAGPALDPALSLRLRYGAAQCVLAPSGTDAEYTCALAMGPQPFCSVMCDADEIGSGCLHAAAGLPHAAGGPVGQPLPVQARVACLRLRDADGTALPAAAVDDQAHAIAAAHAAMPLLLHHVPCSKTGLAAPSESACLQIQRSHAGGARIVVDASQGRCSPADVRRWLGLGWAVILTGSKFLGAPPFCGATLLPPGWPRAQGFACGPGLGSRWRLARELGAGAMAAANWSDALAEAFVPALAAAGIAIDRGGDGLADRQGILSFDPGLDGDATRRLHRRLIVHGAFIGQPVRAGRRTLLRVARGAGTQGDRAGADLQRLAHLLLHELAHG